jgi:hypothetical protein
MRLKSSQGCKQKVPVDSRLGKVRFPPGTPIAIFLQVDFPDSAARRVGMASTRLFLAHKCVKEKLLHSKTSRRRVSRSMLFTRPIDSNDQQLNIGNLD